MSTIEPEFVVPSSDGNLLASPGAPADPPRKSNRDPRVAASARVKTETYGSFMIDESEFAIPVDALQEIVNEPEEIAAVPLAPDFMLGLFNLRGNIIPVVDIRLLLGFPLDNVPTSRKVAIIHHGAHLIGLSFDQTGEVLNSQGAARVDFHGEEGSIKDLVIEAVLKFDGGERLVQVLNPYELLKLEKVPRADNRVEQSQRISARGERQNCLSFQTGHTFCAIDLRHVREVREMTDVDRSLFAHGCVLGTINLRGIILPVVDFRAFMGDDAVFDLRTHSPKGRKLLILDTIEGPVGMMVYSIDSIISYYEGDVLPFAKLALPRSDFVNGCLVDEKRHIVMMLDINKLKEEPNLALAAKSCQEIYPPENPEIGEVEKLTAGERQTFICFTFGNKFALDTAVVSEVINRPDEILEPPFALDFVEGIVNLRGELITLINPRLLYGMEPGPDTGQKVLIFNYHDEKYAIVVDSVDEIIMTNESSVSELKSMDRQHAARSVSEDISGCLQHSAAHGSFASVLILNTSALVERCLAAADLET